MFPVTLNDVKRFDKRFVTLREQNPTLVAQNSISTNVSKLHLYVNVLNNSTMRHCMLTSQPFGVILDCT